MLERKDLGIRLVAAIIDAVILTVVMTLVTSVTVGMLGRLSFLIAGLIGLAYPCIELLKGQSPGKMILKLKVTAEDGSPPSRDQMIRRTMIRWSPTLIGSLLTIVAMVVPFVAMLGNLALVGLSIALLVMSLKTIKSTRQAFWDVQAKTAVMGPVAAGIAVPIAAVQPTEPTQA